ncbi:MAG TPA: hypothetical protein VFB07_11855 [Vicinamibacterales bacterium]|nr:hypothetical protein [Vicinamibacterales bacterium]
MQRTIFAGGVLAASVAALAAQGKPQTWKNLQMTPTGVELTDKGSLRDCPPGTNTVNSVARAGEQIANVTVAFKVLPGFMPGPMKRPVVTAADGKTYNTSVQFVDVGSVPEFSCTFVYRVPQGTQLKSMTIEDATLDLSGLAK